MKGSQLTQRKEGKQKVCRGKGKAEVWHSEVLSLYLMTVNSEEGKIINYFCDRRVKLTLRHHFLVAELTLLFLHISASYT